MMRYTFEAIKWRSLGNKREIETSVVDGFTRLCTRGRLMHCAKMQRTWVQLPSQVYIFLSPFPTLFITIN